MRRPLLYLLFLCSGAAGLIYELVWVRELIFVFGGTTYAITTVLVAFMAGLGLGSFCAGRWCGRLQRPGRVYGTLEILIGLYALLVPALFSAAVPVYRSLYPHLSETPWLLNLVRFSVGWIVLLVPTTCMGATLPVLVRYVTLHGRALGRAVGHLYGINTLGAVLGTTAAGFWLIPALGLLHTTWLAATLNIVIGVLAVNLLHQPVPGPALTSTPKPRGRTADQPGGAPLPRGLRCALLAGFAVSGFAAMVYQITWTRALVLAIGSTTYAFTCILAAFILGLALGSIAVARWVDRWRNPVFAFGVFEVLIGLVAVVIVPIHGHIPLVVQSLVAAHHTQYATLMIWQILLIIAVTFVPTFLMGAIFPLVIRALAADGDEPGAATGRVYLVNTVGTIAGSFLAGFVLIRSEVLGVQNSIILASVLNGLVGVALILLARPATGSALLRRAALPIAGLILIPVVGLGAGRWDQRIMTAAPFLNRGATRSLDRDLVFFAEGVDVTVTVEHPTGSPLLTLTVNGKPDASTSPEDMITNLLLGHLPALLAPQARTACNVGLGSGVTLAALACHPSFERLDYVEISDEVVRAAGYFAPYNYNVLTRDPRVHQILADGRNHLLLANQSYDVIVSEPSNPWMAGIANLFTREFFEVARGRLTDDGLLAVWLHGYKMSLRDFRMVVHTLFDVFGHVSLWELAEDDYLLIASEHPQQIDYAEFARRFHVPTVWADLYRASIPAPAQILGRYITGDEPLRVWAQSAPVHTDDNALLEFSAARHMYSENRAIAEALLSQQRPVLADLLTGAPPPEGLNTEVENVVAARWAPLRAAELNANGDMAGALRLLVSAYSRNPHNLQLFKFILDSRQNVIAAGNKLTANPDIAAALAQIALLPVPEIAPLTGATLADIAAHARTTALRAEQQQRWPAAVDLLRQAQELEPENVETALSLSAALDHLDRPADAAAVLDEVLRRRPEEGRVAYARAVLAAESGDLDTALTHLTTALKWGAVTPQSVAQDERLQVLHGERRFQALVAQPDSKPAE